MSFYYKTSEEAGISEFWLIARVYLHLILIKKIICAEYLTAIRHRPFLYIVQSFISHLYDGQRDLNL